MPPLQSVTINAKVENLASLQETPKLGHNPGYELLLPAKPCKKRPTREIEVALNDVIVDLTIICNGGQLSAHKSGFAGNLSLFYTSILFRRISKLEEPHIVLLAL